MYFSGSLRVRDDVRRPYSSGFFRKSGFEATAAPGLRLTGTAAPPPTLLLLEPEDSEPDELDSFSEPDELTAAP